VGDDPQAALALIVGEGVFDFEAVDGYGFRGALGMTNGYALALQGQILAAGRSGFSIVGLGIVGTATEGWRYEYHGVAGDKWLDAVHQVPCLLGTVIRLTRTDRRCRPAARRRS
jgi:hypothetical protein